MNRLLILTCIFLATNAISFSQEYGIAEEVSTKELFKMGNYRGALKEYLEKSKEEPNNAEYKHKIGACYLNIAGDKSRAVPYLKEAINLDSENLQAKFDLAKSYHFLMDFDKAIDLYKNYKDKTTDPMEIENASRQIEMCLSGKELIKFPIDIAFENLGEKINSPFPDYSPFIPEDESFIIFTSRRKTNKGSFLDYDGYKASDIYFSNVKKGIFSRPQNLTIVNTESDEEAAGISPDGSNILVFVDDLFQNIYGNIYLSQRRGRSFQSLKSIGETVNSSTSIETAACLTSNGEVLYFASDKKGGNGGTDLYMSKKLPNGKWGKPENLGDGINSKYNEDYPSISRDGKTLYFSSEGHNSMGGYDLFKSQLSKNNDKWSTPLNLGYPLNNTRDNMNISFSAHWSNETETSRNRYAYVAAYREEGFGDLDIYRVTFNSVEPLLTTITGTITEKLPIDNSEYKLFYTYSKGTRKITCPEECHPWYDKSWKLEEEKKVKVRPGYQYRTSLYFIKNGEKKIFSSKKYPAADPNYKFENIKSSLIKKKNYIPPEIKYTQTPLPDAIISIVDMNNGTTYNYVATQSGKYVAILTPGKYKIQVEVEEKPYAPIIKTINLYDKISFESKMKKDFVFEPPATE